MTESSQRPLEEIVAELHQALEGAGNIGQESRQSLESAVAEIREALREPDAERAVEGIAGPLRQRLSHAVERFEGSHPRLTALVGRVADALSELGI